MSPLQLISKITVLLFFVLKDCDSLKILKYSIPSPALLHSAVIVNCDYSFGNEPVEGLVVKYFYEDDLNPVYQWIHGYEPQDHGLLKDRLDLTYKSSADGNKMYSAFKVLNATFELTGDYTCVVSTFQDEVRMTKKMVVYVPETSFEFTQEETEKEVILKCTATGIFPQPEFNITWSDENKSFLVSSDVASYNSSSTMLAVIKLQKNEVTTRTSFYCNLNIPDTEYIRKKVITIPSEDSSSHRSSQAVTFFVFLSCLVTLRL